MGERIVLRVDVIELSKVIGAVSVILGTIIGVYKLYDKLIDKLSELERRVSRLEKENQNIEKENALVIYALGACLDGLRQKGCNGKVTTAIDKISKYINNAAHHQD